MDTIIYDNIKRELESLKRENSRLKEEIAILTQKCNKCENVKDAVENEHIRCLQYFHKDKWIEKNIDDIIKNDKLILLDYLVQTKKEYLLNFYTTRNNYRYACSTYDFIRLAIEYNKLDIFKYLRSYLSTYIFSYDDILNCIRYGNLEFVKYVLSCVNINNKTDTMYTYTAAHYNKLDILQYLHTNGFSLSNDIIRCNSADFDCFKYAIDNGCIPTKKTLSEVCKNNDDKKLTYLLTLNVEYTIDELICSSDYSYDKSKCFEILYSHNAIHNFFKLTKNDIITIYKHIDYNIPTYNYYLNLDNGYLREFFFSNSPIQKCKTLNNIIKKTKKKIEDQKNACKTLLEYELHMDVIKYEVCKYF